MMTKKVKIHNIPTSRLAYYRVYRSESPFTTREINEELSSRPYVSMETSTRQNRTITWEEYVNHKSGMKALQPRFINIEDDEAKIAMRGRGLEKYALDTNTNIYEVLKIVLGSGIAADYSSELINIYTMPTVLTWSERVLFYMVSKRLLGIMTARVRSMESTLASYEKDLGSASALARGIDTIKVERAIHLNERLKDERRLRDYFQSQVDFFKKGCILDDIDKIPFDYLEETDVLTPTPFHPITSRIIPNGYYESLLDRIILNRAVGQESRIIASQEGKLFSSMTAMCDTYDDVPNNVKRLVIEPLKPSQK